MTKLTLFITCFTLLISPSSINAEQFQPDYEREDRIANQIVPEIFDGDAVWLQANNRDFYSIYTQADSAKGAVIVMHGREVSPEDTNVAGPLRIALAENGWSSFAMQMPVLEKGHTYNDYQSILKFSHARIEAGLKYLREQGVDRILIAAHSCGAHMANDWFNTNSNRGIDGYIAIGLGATDKDQPLQTPIPIASLKIPVLDIYGEKEFPAPLSMVEERKKMLAANGNPHSQQIMVPDANHYFDGYSDNLVEQVLTWLDGLN